jgi:hypothetical protein
MSTLTLRTAKGSPLTNAEVDANFTNLLVALGGVNTSPYTVPTPTGTGNPVLSIAPTITGHPTIEGVTSTGATGTGNLVFSASPTFTGTSAFASLTVSGNEYIGSQANSTRFPNASVVVSSTVVGIQKNESHNIGLLAEGTASLTDANVYGIGLYGVGYTNGGTRSGGVVGEGHVSASADTGSAIGVRGYSNDTHAGGMNIGLYGDAANGSSSYSLYLNNGDIYSVGAKSWALNGNLTFSGAYSVTIPTLSLTNALTIANGGTGLNTIGTNGQILTSNGTTASWQNAPISLPTQTSNANKYLTTDGTTASWSNTLTSIKTKVIQELITSVTASTATTTIDLSLGTVFVVTISSNTTFAFTNVPAGTDMTSFTIITVNDATAGRAVSWPASVTWAGGMLPTRTTAANKSDAWSFFTRDAGTTIVGSLSVANY